MLVSIISFFFVFVFCCFLFLLLLGSEKACELIVQKLSEQFVEAIYGRGDHVRSFYKESIETHLDMIVQYTMKPVIPVCMFLLLCFFFFFYFSFLLIFIMQKV
jgi:hypothetical protein